jgi:hypothetical protein
MTSEQLVVKICVRWLGPGVTLFAPVEEAPRTALIRVTHEARPAAGAANGFAGSP